MSKKEISLYEPIMNELKWVFGHLGDCHLEITADKRFSNKLKKEFSKDTLYIIKVEGFYPDITGFVRTKYSTDIITVEVKRRKITLRNLFQAKAHGEIFNAKHSFLISPVVIPEEIRRFIKDRSDICNYSYNRKVIIAQFDENKQKFEIDKELYPHGDIPELIRNAYGPTAYFFNPQANFGNLIPPLVITKDKKAYLVSENWTIELIKNRKIPAVFLSLEDPENQFKKWLSEKKYEQVLRPITREELSL